MKQNWKPILVLLLLVAAVWYLVPTVQYYGLTDEELASKQRNAPAEYYALQRGAVNLGLDLQGGIHLVMEVDLEGLTDEEKRDAVDRAQEVIRNRVDQFGVAEPTIQRQGENRIIVELPGLQDVERAKGLIGQTALLEFQLVEPDEDRNRLVQRISTVLAARGQDSAEETESAAATSTDTEAETPSLFGTESEQDTNLFDEVEGTSDVATLESMLTLFGNDMLVEQRSLPAVKAMLADPVADGAVPDDVEFLFSSKAYEVFEGRLVRASESSSGSLYYVMYLVRKKPEMTGNLVESAFVSIGQNVEYMGQPIVNFETTDEGVRVFRSVTGGHIGERLGIVLDGTVYSAPTIQTKIYSGRSIITGSGTEEEAKDLGIVLRAGALPARVEIIEDRTVGPSLGHDSIEQGKMAGIISMVLIALFMLLYYRLAGLVADVALALNMVFVLAVLAAFHATLTLPGIAGIILTIGMAVDANVLIFERIREELRAGKTIRAAIDSGYNNALSAIIDANLTTFIVGLVLYEFGTGPIRGFALTLCIGIVSSLFTAFIVTRLILEILTARSQSTMLSIGPINILANVRIRFLSMRKTALMVSAGVFAIGLISVVGINHLKLGIDFAGGTLLELHFDPPVSVEQIRDLLDEVDLGGSTVDLSASEIKRFGSDNDIIIRVSESETGTDVADGIKQVLKSGLAANIQNDLEWVRRQEKVGPKIGFELREQAVQAVLTSLVLILVYMAWRFRQFLFGIAAVVALFHDVLITLGLLSVLDVEITLVVVAALLAIVGYSLNDTIVVFDRVRENLLAGRARDGFAELLDLSINECLSRTVVTSMTTLFAVVVLMGWGGEVIRDFTITLFIGILVGTYSSVFVASPVLYFGHARRAARDEDRKKAKRK
jgi:SecD/SecF fusion protein